MTKRLQYRSCERFTRVERPVIVYGLQTVEEDRTENVRAKDVEVCWGDKNV